MAKSDGAGPVFLLGLGAQKSGTTWLHQYLTGSEQFNGGVAKEYHVWDALDMPVMRHKRANFTNLLRGGKLAERYRMQRESTRYFDYFEELFRNGAELTADLSPSYSGLGKDRLTFIRDNFTQRGIATKAIILVRDPLNRIKSAVRYNLRKKNYNEGIKRGETDFLAALRQYYTTEECRVRTTYQDTIKNAQSAFGLSDLYIGVYETMFEQSEIERLSNFCNVPAHPHLANVCVKKTEGPLGQDRRLEADIRHAFRETYAFCAKLIPETEQLWHPVQDTSFSLSVVI